MSDEDTAVEGQIYLDWSNHTTTYTLSAHLLTSHEPTTSDYSQVTATKELEPNTFVKETINVFTTLASKANLQDLDTTLDHVSQNEFSLLEMSPLTVTSSTHKELVVVVFVNVTIEGCENAMRCTGVCGPRLNQTSDSQDDVNTDLPTTATSKLSRSKRGITSNTSAALTMDDAGVFFGDAYESTEFPERFVTDEMLSNAFFRKKLQGELSYFKALPKKSLIRRRRELSENMSSFECKCDPICIEFGDCCVDSLLYCFGLLDKDDQEIEEFFANRNKEGDVENFDDIPLSKALLNNTDFKKISLEYLKTFGSCMRFDDFTNDRVISLCPQSFPDKEIAAKCQSKLSPLLPAVSFALEPNFYITFKNIHCAICHGIQKRQLIAWESSIHCSDGVDGLSSEGDDTSVDFERLSNFVLDGLCEVHFTTAEPIPAQRTCSLGYDVTSELKAELDNAVTSKICSHTEAKLCMAYILPMVNSIRNLHCHKCTSREVSMSQRRRRSSALTECLSDHEIVKKPIGGVLVLLDVTGRYSHPGTGGNRDAYFCRDDQIFDPLELTCKDFTCGEVEEPYRGTCIIKGGVYLPPTSQLYPNQWNTTMLSITHSQSTEGDIIDCHTLLNILEGMVVLKEFLPRITNISIDTYFSLIVGKEEYISEEIYMDNIQCREKYHPSESVAILQEFNFLVISNGELYEDVFQDIGHLSELIIQSYMKGNGTMIFTNIGALSVLSSCPENHILTLLDDFESHTHKGIEYAAVNASGTQFNFPVMHLGFKISSGFYSGEIDVTSSKFDVWVCLQNDIFAWKNCSLTTYWRNETKFTLGGTELEVLRSGRRFNKNQVYELEDKILICDDLSSLDRSIVPGQKQETDEIYKQLNLVCSSISILFLCVMLLVYWMFPELRTLPGRLISCMAATMMLSFVFNLLTLFDLRHKVMCPIAAVVAHFVTLAYYGWMSAIAVNMSLTFGFSKVRCHSADEDSKLFRRYSVAVWGIAALVVATSLALDLTHGEAENPIFQPFLKDDSSTSFPTSFPQRVAENFSYNDFFTAGTPSETRKDSIITKTDLDDAVSANGLNLTVTEIERYDDFPRYGYPLCTWFSGPLWTRLAFVLVPYGLTFVIDVIGFALTVRGILKSAKASAKKLDRQIETRSQVIIFLKLSTTVGISWAISVFFTVSQSRILIYVYTSLVLLQGLLLFLAFMVNKRVITLLMKRCACTSRWLYKVKLSSQTNSSSNFTRHSEIRN